MDRTNLLSETTEEIGLRQRKLALPKVWTVSAGLTSLPGAEESWNWQCLVCSPKNQTNGKGAF